MNIALIAQDSKKELIVRFCIAYSGILSRHSLCATSSTGRLIEESTGLRVTKFMDSYRGGCQQISAKISCGEIDLVIFFRNGNNPELMGDSENDVLRLCDVHSIPLATNIATAEVLIRGLEQGYLDWRTNRNSFSSIDKFNAM